MRTTRSSSHLDEDDFNQAIAAEVRGLLGRKKKKQADVVRYLGINPNAAGFRWNGKTPWSTAELILLCDWLEMDACEVMAAAKAAALEQSAARDAQLMLTDEERAFAAEIQAERTAQGLTQAELAKKARLGESIVKRIEAEAMQADSEQLSKLCRALGITITELATRAERRIRSEARRNTRRASGG